MDKKAEVMQVLKKVYETYPENWEFIAKSIRELCCTENVPLNEFFICFDFYCWLFFQCYDIMIVCALFWNNHAQHCFSCRL